MAGFDLLMNELLRTVMDKVRELDAQDRKKLLELLRTQGRTMQRRRIDLGDLAEVLETDYLLEIGSRSADVEITLPDPADHPDRILMFKDGAGLCGTGGDILLFPSTGGIDGGNLYLTTAWASARLYSNGSDWLSW